MKLLLSFCFSVFCSFILTSQNLSTKSRITVLGFSRYTEVAIGQVVKIQFLEDPSKCDPRKGNMTLEQQIDYFAKAVAKEGIQFQLFKEADDNLDTKFKQKVYKYFAKEESEINKVKSICANLDVRVLETYFKMPNHDFGSEDLRAVEAVKNATKRAKAIAQKLGNKKVKLLSINDDTSEVEISSILGKYEDDVERYEFMLELYELMSVPSSNSEKSFEPKQLKGYSILATFSIE